MTLLKIDRNKTIIGDKFDFDMIPYMSFYEYLTNNVDNLDTEIEEGTTTTSIGYNVRTVAKFEYSEFNSMKVRATLDTKLRDNEFIAFSTDAECKDIFTCLNVYNIQNNDSSYINSNRFYVHYPYTVPQTLGYGRNNNYQLAIGVGIEYTDKFFPMFNFDVPLQKLFNRQDFTFGLGKDGKIYI